MREEERIGARIRGLRKAQKLTQAELGERLGVKKSTVSDWEAGRRGFNTRLLRSIAQALSCSIEYLIDGAEDARPEAARLLPRRTSPEAAPVRIPVLGTIPAGMPLEAIEDVLDWEEIPGDWTRGGKEYFALQVRGDSMLPEYRSGDILILRRQDTCENGDDCAVLVAGEDATFKRVRISEKGVTLMPLNPAFEPLFFSTREVAELPVRVVGVVVELRRTMPRARL